MKLNHSLSTIALSFSLTATWSMSVLAIGTPTSPQVKNVEAQTATVDSQLYSQAKPQFSFKRQCFRYRRSGVYQTLSWWESAPASVWKYIHDGECYCEKQNKADCLEPNDPADAD
jgi:hypothetical protein